MEIQVEVRRSKRFRRMSLRVSTDGRVWVNVPYSIDECTVKQFIHLHREWIEKQLHKRAQAKKNIIPAIEIGAVQKTRLFTIFIKQTTGASCLKQNEREVTLYFNDEASATERYDRFKHLLLQIYKREATILLPERIHRWANQMGVSYGKISFRNNKTNWGSCSASNNLSFNYQAMSQTDEVLDYLIIHELAHIKHKDHSPNFWAFVGSFCPNFAEMRKLLKKTALL